VESVITVVRSGAVADYGFDDGVTSLLAHGPGLMDRLQGPGGAPLIEHEDLGGGALLDADRNGLQVWWAGPMEDRVVDRLARLWPGWTMRRHAGGLRRQVELSGRDAAGIDPDEDEAARRLVAVFFEDSALDPREVRRLLLKDGVRADRGLEGADSAAGAKGQIAAYLAGVLRAGPDAGP